MSTGTLRYPLLLVPGLLGFVRMPGNSYWHGIEAALLSEGVQVHALRLPATHSHAVRGEQLLTLIERIRRVSGAARVNLLGHSQGALAARYAAAKRPDLVASVTSVAGPNQGSELADYLRQRFPSDSLGERLLAGAVGGLSWLMARLERCPSGLPQPRDVLAAHHDLTSVGMAEFNRLYPQGLPREWGGEGAHEVNGVRYYSWSGVLRPGVTDQGDNRRDPSQRLCRYLSRCFVREAGQNDGMVGRFSSHLGQVIRSDYPFDHLDIINQWNGRAGPGLSPVQVYVEHARRLAQAGL